MKKYIVAAFAALLTLSAVQAQEKWTLEKCIDYALKNNINLKTSELNTQSQTVRYKMSKNQRLPSVSGSASQNMSFGQSQNNQGIYENINSQSYSGGISSSVSLFSGFQVKNAIDAQHFNLLASIEDLKKAKESIAINIASAYLQILYNKELYQLALEQVSLSQNQLTRYESMASLGKIPAGQVFEAKAQLAKDKLSATESQSTLKLSLLDLSQLLDLKDEANFDVAAPTLDIKSISANIHSANDVFNYAVLNKPTIKASEYRLQSSEKNLASAKGAYYPKLGLGANYSNVFYPSMIDRTTGKKMTLKNQTKINGRSGIGLNLSIPIFSRFDTKNNIKLSKFEVENAKLEVENAKKTLYKEIQQAWFNTNTASEKYQASTETVINTEEAFRFAEEKFNNGRSTIYEFNDAKMSLASARSNQLQAKYNYLFSAKILDFYNGEKLSL